MTVRVLPPDEWNRLVGTELESVWPILNRETTSVMVVEHEGEIVGCWAMFPVTHVEGITIKEGYRSSPVVAMKLLRMMRSLCRDQGIKTVVTGSLSNAVSRYIERLGGVEVPGKQFAISLESEGLLCQLQ